MKKYNDYTEAVLRYLRKLNELKAYYVNLQEEIASKEEILRTVSTPIARYSLSPAGGGENCSSVERDWERRTKIEDELNALRINKTALKINLAKLERALDSLDDESRRVVMMRWIDGRKWEYIAITLHCSPKNCRDKGKAALEKIALMVFGPAAMPEQLSFVFFSQKPVDKVTC